MIRDENWRRFQVPSKKATLFSKYLLLKSYSKKRTRNQGVL